jgi:hypothetical protein
VHNRCERDKDEKFMELLIVMSFVVVNQWELEMLNLRTRMDGRMNWINKRIKGVVNYSNWRKVIGDIEKKT